MTDVLTFTSRAGRHVLLVDGSRIYDVDEATFKAVAADPLALCDAPGSSPYLDAVPPEPPPLLALSLNVAQACNLAGRYCYADTDHFGEATKAMSAETAIRTVDLLLGEAEASGRAVLGFVRFPTCFMPRCSNNQAMSERIAPRSDAREPGEADMVRYALAAAAGLTLLGSWPAGPAASATVVQRQLPAAAGQAGSLARSYKVVVPDGLQAGTPVPLVMVLHGCLQSDDNMLAETRFKELADRERFVAVFPFITDWDRSEQRNDRCWGFWFDQHQHESRGEPGDLRRILAAVENEFTVDPDRRYITGLSSGAAMAVVMAVIYSEDFAAAGAVAGLPYDEDACAVANACPLQGIRFKPVNTLVASMAAEQAQAGEQRLVPLMTVHSRNDRTVPFQNAQNLRDVWIARYGASSQAEESDCTREGVNCDHGTFRDGAGRSVVETVFYDGPPFVKSHAWIGDNAGPFADPTGPSATDLLWAFFEANPRNAGPAAQITFDTPVVNGLSMSVSGTVNSETAIGGVFVRLDGAAPQAEKPAGNMETWSASFDNLVDNRSYVPVVRVELADGSERSAVGPAITLGDTVIHANATFQNYIIAGRIAVQQPPCTPGFGACDADFNSLFFRFGMNPFELHAASAAGPWFVDPTRLAN